MYQQLIKTLGHAKASVLIKLQQLIFIDVLLDYGMLSVLLRSPLTVQHRSMLCQNDQAAIPFVLTVCPPLLL